MHLLKTTRLNTTRLQTTLIKTIIYIMIFGFLTCSVPIQATSISEGTPYTTFCQMAADDDEIFSTFKRHPIYQQILEHVPYKTGLEYLEIIVNEYPDLIHHFGKFRENDLLGAPITFSYDNYGFFSPTTLRYIKMAGDLKKQLGDLSQLHIVEIGGGYGGLCKILSCLGFGSYTLVDLPEVIALNKKYLGQLGVENVNFIESTNLEKLGTYDLVISNYAFSEIDKKEQLEYFDKAIKDTPNGYLTMNFISHYHKLKSLTLDEFVSLLFFSGKSGKVQKERPLTGANNVLVTWRAVNGFESQVIFNNNSNSNHLYPIYDPTSQNNAVSYSLSGGRLGDNLVSYFHAKWIAYKYGLPFLYYPFPFSDQLALDDRDQNVMTFNFPQKINITNEKMMTTIPESRSLLVIPYSPECRVDYAALPTGKYPLIEVDWDDKIFREEMMESLALKKPVETLDLPENIITVGVHVRRGGGFDNYESERKRVPLKFPPDSYYIEQIKRIANIFSNQNLYVYIMTDDLNPQKIVAKYKAAVNNPRLIFDCRAQGNSPHDNIFADFFSIAKFDCFIRAQSNFSIMATYLADHSILISPRNYTVVNKEIVVNETEMIFRGSNR